MWHSLYLLVNANLRKFQISIREFQSFYTKCFQVKTYKKQIEEAEEIAALNLAKFRKSQQELEETEER